MSTLQSVSINSPIGRLEECAQFTIETSQESFTLFGAMIPNREQTFSCWVRSDADGSLIFNGTTVTTATDWKEQKITFTPTTDDFVISFASTGTYYIYHAQIELGNKNTDWTLAHEDLTDATDKAQAAADHAQADTNNVAGRVTITESMIQQLSDTIATLITDKNGMSLMTQTSTGWTFSIGTMQTSIGELSDELGDLSDALNGTDKTVEEVLRPSIDRWNETNERVRIGTYEGEPCIELGEGDSDFKLLVTNTRIMFMVGSDVPTYIDHESMYTKKINVTEELRQAGYVWAGRANGNYGLQWKG